MFCKNCGTKIKDTARFCPGCGMKVERKTDRFVCPTCGEPVKAGEKFCRNCGTNLGSTVVMQAPQAIEDQNHQVSMDCTTTLNQPSVPALQPLPKRVPSGSAASVVTTAITSATITDGDPVPAPMRKPQTGKQNTPRRASDRMKQQAGTMARQAVKTVFQKIMEIETPASSVPGEIRTALNSEQMSVLSSVARSLFKR